MAGVRLRTAHHPYVAAITFAGFATVVLYACNSSKPIPTEKEMTTAEDEIYEAVVHRIFTPVNGKPHVSQLVFADTLRTELELGADIESCKKSTRKDLALEIAPPFYNSLADKAYRFVSRGDYDRALREDTIESFLERSCAPGPLSQTFHTDLPRKFIPQEKAHFRGQPMLKDESKSFERLYPGASGIISFSHVGFDSTLDEAIVSTGFVCGGLCGTGYRYVLRKKSGRWEVVEWLMVWVS